MMQSKIEKVDILLAGAGEIMTELIQENVDNDPPTTAILHAKSHLIESMRDTRAALEALGDSL